ncbi:MAG: glycosyltransferase family 39 protein [Elusimicrobia bacterium]|nr:glycosyltransferase family 39 protein [Elusimicrobiota bacterium]
MGPKSAPALAPAAFLGALLAVTFVTRLPTLQRARLPDGEVVYWHPEGDEDVFQTLIERVRREPGRYDLQGTHALAASPALYDRPLFFHPPVFVYLAALAEGLGLPLPLFPVLLNLATIALVYGIARALYGEEPARWAAFLAAACPVGWFLSQKIWIDNMAVAASTAAFGAAVWASTRPRPLSFALAGAAFGLAFLSKVSAVFLLPAVLAVLWGQARRGFAWRELAAFAAPAALLSGAWLGLYRCATGEWLQPLPPAGYLEAKPFLRAAWQRPWHYYLSSLATISPVYLLALARWRRRAAADLGPAVWFAAFCVGMTAFGLSGGTFQTRFLAPAYPALALLTGAEAALLGPTGRIALAALAGYGMMNAGLFAVLESPLYADFERTVAGLILERLTEVGQMRFPGS